jgi:WD40 repeat protein
LATGGGYSDPSVALWDVQSGKQVPQFNGHTKDVEPKDVENRDVEAVAFHPNQKWLISASETGRMKIWDVNSGNELLSIVSIPGGDEYVAYTPKGCYTGSANAASYVRYVTQLGDQSGTALLVPNGATDFLLPQ